MTVSCFCFMISLLPLFTSFVSGEPSILPAGTCSCLIIALYEIHSLKNNAATASSHTVVDRFQQSVIHIQTEIDRLNKISNIVHRASTEARVSPTHDLRSEHNEEGETEEFEVHLFQNRITDQFPATSDTIRHRLAVAMLRRHRMFLYRSKDGASGSGDATQSNPPRTDQNTQPSSELPRTTVDLSQ